MVTTIYRVLPQEEWERARTAGVFTGTAHDVRDGYIHFSTRAQLAETLARHYRGQSDLVLLSVRAADLEGSLRWEPAREGALFPHLYANLPTSAVVAVAPLPLAANGVHVLPSLLDE